MAQISASSHLPIKFELISHTIVRLRWSPLECSRITQSVTSFNHSLTNVKWYSQSELNQPVTTTLTPIPRTNKAIELAILRLLTSVRSCQTCNKATQDSRIAGADTYEEDMFAGAAGAKDHAPKLMAHHDVGSRPITRSVESYIRWRISSASCLAASRRPLGKHPNLAKPRKGWFDGSRSETDFLFNRNAPPTIKRQLKAMRKTNLYPSLPKCTK